MELHYLVYLENLIFHPLVIYTEELSWVIINIIKTSKALLSDSREPGRHYSLAYYLQGQYKVNERGTCSVYQSLGSSGCNLFHTFQLLGSNMWNLQISSEQ